MVETPGELRAGESGRNNQTNFATNMKKLDVPQSGKIGMAVSVKTRYGLIQRQYVIPKDPKTPGQLRSRANMGRFSAYWRVLTPEQSIAWRISGRSTLCRSLLGKASFLTGSQLFNKINCARAAIGLGMLMDPPPPAQFGPNPVEELHITNNGGGIALTLSVPTAPTDLVIVYGAGPCSAGISFVRNFTMLGRLPAPAGGLSDITDLYVAKYGVPPVGSQVCIRTRQQINGWEDLPKQTNAIVPKA